jgi:2-methylisocitrate lyase-like PEP mutase family enzyme
MAGRTAAGRAASSPAIPPRPDAQRAAAPRSWVNGRTDLFLHADDKQAVAGEAIARMQALAEAGADSVYPVRIQDDDAMTAMISDWA